MDEWQSKFLSQQFTDTHLYCWVKGGSVKFKCGIAQEHNTTIPAMIRIWRWSLDMESMQNAYDLATSLSYMWNRNVNIMLYQPENK